MTAPAFSRTVRVLLNRREAAEILRVDPDEVTRMASRGIIWHTRTPGGHRRFSEIRELAARNAGQATS